MPAQVDYSELLHLQSAAHALDRINQAFADNDMTDSELAVFVGARLEEAGYKRADSAPTRGPMVITMPFGQSGSVHYGSQFYSAERRHEDGVVIYHNGAVWQRADAALTETFESNASMMVNSRTIHSH